MRKEIWLVIILAIVIVVLGGVAIFLPGKNNNQQTNNNQNQQPPVSGIQVASVKEGDTISSPLKITGTVNGGGWAGFEGQVGVVRLLDYKGSELGLAILQATTDWMQFPVSFEANLAFQASADQNGTLVFSNENPSGEPSRDKQFAIPVKIKKGAETTALKVYFGKNEITGSTCSVVFPVDRSVPKTQAVAKAAIEEMLKGPTQAEKDAGYFSSIPAGSKLNSIKIENGTAYADFNQITESGGGSCSMAERVSQINFTLKQFSTIKKVVLSIDGRTGDIFQP